MCVLLQVYARDFRDSALEAAPTTPGMKYRHYSPSAPVLLLDPAPAWQQQQQGRQLLQQLVSDATEELLQRVQHGHLQELSAAHSVAQRVVLLSTCGAGGASNSSSTCSLQDVFVGWTPESVALLEAHSQQQQQQQQQQQCGSDGIAASAAGGSGADTIYHLPFTKVGDTDGSDAAAGKVEVLEYVLGSWQQPELVAQQLFGALRAADQAGAGLILVQGLPPVGTGLAVMNRLQKAASRRMAVEL
jgi:L-threonylcarbamoyladenylate synthase